MTRKVKIGEVAIGGNQPLALVAGPCVIENEKSTLSAAERLQKICERAGVPLIFKASYDKANRTSLSSYRGPGIAEGLRILAKVKKELGLPVLTDVHWPGDAMRAGDVVDVLQIPAFLCRQTDLLIAAAKTKKAVNIKKGQFVAPWNMEEAARKVSESGNENILLTERGTAFGYNNLVVDFRSLAVMRDLGYPVIFDATHSVQLPGGCSTSSGGERQYVTPLARAAVAFGIDALFLEVHERPQDSPCDGPNMIAMEELARLLPVLKEVHRCIWNRQKKSST